MNPIVSTISAISYLVPVTTLVTVIYLYLLFRINLFSINYDFNFKFYLSILLGILSSIYVFYNINFNYIAIFFGCILTIFIFRGFRSFNSNSFKLSNLLNNIKIIELIYNLKNHPKEMTHDKVKKLLPLINRMENKNLKNYILKLINKVNLKGTRSESETEKYSNTESESESESNNNEMEEIVPNDSSESNIEKYSNTETDNNEPVEENKETKMERRRRRMIEMESEREKRKERREKRMVEMESERERRKEIREERMRAKKIKEETK